MMSSEPAKDVIILVDLPLLGLALQQAKGVGCVCQDGFLNLK